MPLPLLRGAGVLLAVSCALQAAGQTTGNPSVATFVQPAPGAIVPHTSGLTNLLSGFNAAVTVSGVHDSAIGWYTVVTPAVSYTFSPRIFADASLSVYPHRLVQNQQASTQQLTQAYGAVSDTFLGLHANSSPLGIRNTTSLSLTLPTGNRNYGLGLGTPTVDLSNRSERYFGQKAFLLDMGLGDSSGFFNRLVPGQDSTLAPIAHFQAGIVTPFALHTFLQTTAYEQLPLGDQKVYTAIQRRNGPPYLFISGRKVTEDNGFITSLNAPLSDHLDLSASYTRSLRLRLDTVSVGFTLVWKGSGRKRSSLIDRALAEAERSTP